MPNRTFLKGSPANLRKVSEGPNIIFRFKGANCVHNSGLLLSLSLLETANISRLDKIGLMRRELNDSNIVHFGLENKLRSLMALGPIH